MTVVGIITVWRDRLEELREFERHAAAVMAAHGGRIERTVVVHGAESPELVREIHVAPLLTRERSGPIGTIRGSASGRSFGRRRL